jgi:NAD(P)-dependent dehydrogenase (short-subunit alcohol dehydrogenase family)
MKFDFADKTVLISGASRGIGRVIARMFAEAGARVVVHYNTNRQAAEDTLAELAGEGHLIVSANLAEVTGVQYLVDTVIEHLGRIDILVNNAAIYEFHPIATLSFTEWQQAWQRTINTNLLGAANLTYLVVQQMLQQGGGRIVNVSSRGAFRGEPEAPAYGASKAGLNAMGQSLAQALAPHHIFVHTVAPGFVQTDMARESLTGSRGDQIRNQSPLGRVATPEEVARTVLFLAAEGTEFLTGCIVDVNGASYLRT